MRKDVLTIIKCIHVIHQYKLMYILLTVILMQLEWDRNPSLHSLREKYVD